MESLLDKDTKTMLEKMNKPLKDRLENAKNELSVTLVLLEKLQVKMKIYLPNNFVSGGK